MDSVMQFGLATGGEVYDFVAKNQTDYNDNFADIMQQTVRVPGKDGGISTFGLGRGPAEVGNVRITFWVFGDNASDVGYQVSRARGMAYWGVRKLFKRHQNGDLMWTYASVSSLQTAQVVRRMPHYRQQVQMTFQCTETKWYGADEELWFLDDGLSLDSGLFLASPRVERQSVADGDTVTVVNRGNAPVSAYVRWDGDGTNSMVNPALSRSNWAGEEVNKLTYTGTIGANDVVEIDARSLETTTRDNLTALSGDWLTIPSGSWDLDVTMTSGQGLLTVDYWDAWV